VISKLNYFHTPVTIFGSGAVIDILGGLIGLGCAEFRLSLVNNIC
jgi:hypothetical protein